MSAPLRKERWPAALGLPLGRAGPGRRRGGESRAQPLAVGGAGDFASGSGHRARGARTGAQRSEVSPASWDRARETRRAKPKVTPRQSVPPRAALRAVWDCHTRPQGTRGQHRPWTYGRGSAVSGAGASARCRPWLSGTPGRIPGLAWTKPAERRLWVRRAARSWGARPRARPTRLSGPAVHPPTSPRCTPGAVGLRVACGLSHMQQTFPRTSLPSLEVNRVTSQVAA